MPDTPPWWMEEEAGLRRSPGCVPVPDSDAVVATSLGEHSAHGLLTFWHVGCKWLCHSHVLLLPLWAPVLWGLFLLQHQPGKTELFMAG